MRNKIRKILCVVLCVGLIAGMTTGCSGTKQASGGKKIIRVALSQSETHPEYTGMEKFKEYVEEKLGDKYEVQIYPNELLGSQTKAIELTQTGAIDFVVVGTPNLEIFADVYEVFSMPYLFTSQEAYYAAMNDTDYMEKVYESTDETGLRVVTWFDVGTRNFYAKKAINTPDDLKGLKMRVQQSPASVKMANAFGAAASPMSFGEVYTAIQQGVIDGAENNELALTDNKHGEVAKYYSYTMHQMIPDVLIANLKFLNGLSEEERQVFYDAAEVASETERDAWTTEVEKAKKTAEEDMGVTFIYPDISLFKEKVSNVQNEMLDANPDIRDLYDHIQLYNKQYADTKEEN
ncbi:TRAP transporter substrate-binding protein [uncultured Eubacterium sp.]|uniref:TRAP transporter substrate-binding protein n=1 Tax=uncultured Eubacterium sp. TaxID=165185 RepID=UPI00345D80EE